MCDDYEELLGTVVGRRVVEGRLGETGFDVIFDNGVVLELYDLCFLMKSVENLDCTPMRVEDHEGLMLRLLGRTVASVEFNVEGCTIRFVLDGGDVVCLPVQYGYVVDVVE